MNPYYEKDGITIYHGDCLEIMPGLGKVDAVVTDPPYGIGMAARKHSSNLARARDYGIDHWDDSTADEAIKVARRVSDRQIIFGGNYYKLPPTPCWLIWDKLNGASCFADAEIAWTNLSGAVRLLRFRWNGMLQENMAAKEHRVHPTQKPVPLMRWCIEKLGPSGVILDPFMGSGTTLVACRQLGRQGIGIEIEEKYCEIAARRLEAFDSGVPLKEAQAGQGALWG